MKLQGYRKFIIAVLGLVSFTLIMLKSTEVDPMNLGLGLAAVVGVFSGANAWKQFAETKK